LIRHTLQIQFTGLALEPLEPLLAASGCIMLHPLVDVWLAKFTPAVNQTGEFVGHGGDGFGGAKAGSQASIGGPQSTFTVPQMLSRQAPGVSCTVDHVAGAASEHSASADPVVRTSATPRSEGFFAFPPAHVQADRRDEGLGGEHLDAVDAGEVHAADTGELGV
jgi:hypothetical protein